MSVRRVSIVLDDFDGRELPAETPAVRLTLGSRSWDLYLAQENLAELERALVPFVSGADSVQRPSGRTAPATAKSIRRWAEEQGHVVPATGRIPKEVRRAYDAAQR